MNSNCGQQNSHAFVPLRKDLKKGQIRPVKVKKGLMLTFPRACCTLEKDPKGITFPVSQTKEVPRCEATVSFCYCFCWRKGRVNTPLVAEYKLTLLNVSTFHNSSHPHIFSHIFLLHNASALILFIFTLLLGFAAT
jgi:hypothetical protein